jgi:nitrilase
MAGSLTEQSRAEELCLLACQPVIPPTPDAASRDAHLTALCARIAAATEPGAQDVVVLPELASMEYSDEAFTRLDALAEPLDGPSFEAFSKLAKTLRCTVVYGFARRTENGVTICQAVVGADGVLLGHYDKLHLAQFGASAEAAAFTPGDHLFSFTVKGLRLAPLICYDIRFADLAQRLASEGVDAVLQCSAYARDLSFHSWRPFVITRAMENGIAWLGLNRAGADWGGSIWCPGHADSDTPEQVFGTDEEFRLLSLPVDFRTGIAEKLPFLKDRRADYANLPMQKGASQEPD